MLDSVKVAYPSDPNATYPLREFASVGTRDGALLVTCYDKDVSEKRSWGITRQASADFSPTAEMPPQMVKHVERAIHLANLGLTPQTTGSGDEGILKIPIPR
jgi:ribosome recycling factor